MVFRLLLLMSDLFEAKIQQKCRNRDRHRLRWTEVCQFDDSTCRYKWCRKFLEEMFNFDYQLDYVFSSDGHSVSKKKVEAYCILCCSKIVYKKSWMWCTERCTNFYNLRSYRYGNNTHQNALDCMILCLCHKIFRGRGIPLDLPRLYRHICSVWRLAPQNTSWPNF